MGERATQAGAGQPRLRRRIVIGIILALVVAAGAGMYLSLEWVEEEIDLGFSDAAKRNPFLAAQQFLQSREHRVQVLKSFSVFDGMAYAGEEGGEITGEDLVVLVNSHRVLRGQRLENLWQWLQGGGSLVVSGYNPFIDDDPDKQDLLLARLPVSLVQVETTEDETADSPDDRADTETDDAVERLFAGVTTDSCDQLSQVQPVVESPAVGGAAGHAFEVGYLNGLQFRPSAGVDLRWHTGVEPYHLLRFRQGAGDATVVSDANIWNNATIGCADHAYALARLAEGRRNVWFVVNMDAPSLWRLLWRAAPFAVVVLTLALVLWLWAKGKRAAPLLPAIPTARRSFLEHVRASATFLWRHRQQGELIERLRSDLLHLINRRYPGFADKGAQQQAAFIGHHLDLAEADVSAALFAPPPDKVADFIWVVNRLQYLRNNL